jgi:hypothetical protein
MPAMAFILTGGAVLVMLVPVRDATHGTNTVSSTA